MEKNHIWINSMKLLVKVHKKKLEVKPMSQQNYGVQVPNLDGNWKNEVFNSVAEIEKKAAHSTQCSSIFGI